MGVRTMCEIHGKWSQGPECLICKEEKGQKTIHRTMLKICLNPILRKFGWEIVSIFDEDDTFIKYHLRKRG